SPATASWPLLTLYNILDSKLLVDYLNEEEINRKYLALFAILPAAILLFLAWRQGWLPNWNAETIRDFILSFGAWAIIVYILLMALNTVTIY
ncbi:MAG: hypothetical protein JSV68_19015, partial [Anaerolineaceae bacterium]